MTSDVRIEVRGLKELQKRAIETVKALEGTPMLRAMQRATLLVTADAKRLAPVDTGRLRASITPKIEQRSLLGSNRIRGIVGSNVAYAPYMEFGTGTFVGRPAHFPPPSALETWAKRHGIGNGFIVARSIFLKGGLKGRFYLTKALAKNAVKIGELLKSAVIKIVEKK